MGVFRKLVAHLPYTRVIPAVPEGRFVDLGAADHALPAPDTTPDFTSALSFFIHYEGGIFGGGRRVTLRRIEARGASLLSFLAHCHERREIRRFRADRVEEAVDMATGEVLDCNQFCEFVMSRSGGLLESRLLAMSKLLVFLGRCDGHMVNVEWEALDQSVVRLHRSLLDDDRGAERLVEEARRLAPDSRDFLKCLSGLTRTRLPSRTHAELRRAIGTIIDADGVHHPSEIAWAIEASDFVGRMPICD